MTGSAGVPTGTDNMLAETDGSREALGMGLIGRSVDSSDLDAFIRSYCATISDNAPLTIGTLKRTVAELLKGPEGDLEECNRLVAICFDSQDFSGGRRAFMEKRRPLFRGI